MFLDAASINRSDATRELCHKSNITVVPTMKHALNTDKRPSILMSCDELHKAIHELRADDIIQCWMNIAHQTIDQLKEKSITSSLNRVDLHRYQPNLNITTIERL